MVVDSADFSVSLRIKPAEKKLAYKNNQTT